MILIVFMIFPWHRKHLFWVGGRSIKDTSNKPSYHAKNLYFAKTLPWQSVSEIRNCLNRCIGAEMSEETLMYFKLSTATSNFE